MIVNNTWLLSHIMLQLIIGETNDNTSKKLNNINATTTNSGVNEMKTFLITFYLTVILSVTYIAVQKLKQLSNTIDNLTTQTEN